MWGDIRFRRLSPLLNSGQALWIYLLTGPRTHSIPGLYTVGEREMAEALGWSLLAYRRAFQEILDEDLVKVDWHARLVWIPKAIHYNQPESPNVVLGWSRIWDELPECSLKSEAYHYIKGFLEGLGKGFHDAFMKATPKTLPKTMPKTMPNQEQEQEQESEQEKEKTPHIKRPPKGTKRQLTEFPNDFILTPTLEAYANTHDIQNPAHTWEHFKAHHLAKGSQFKNWPQAWRTWVLSPIQKNAPQTRKPYAKGDGTIAAGQELIQTLRDKDTSHEPRIVNP